MANIVRMPELMFACLLWENNRNHSFLQFIFGPREVKPIVMQIDWLVHIPYIYMYVPEKKTIHISNEIAVLIINKHM